MAAFLGVRTVPICHNLGNNFWIGEWFPGHLESYYQSTEGVVMQFLLSSFTSEERLASYSKSGFFCCFRVFASAPPVSGFMISLIHSHQVSKNRFGDHVRNCLVIKFGDFVAIPIILASPRKFGRAISSDPPCFGCSLWPSHRGRQWKGIKKGVRSMVNSRAEPKQEERARSRINV